MPALRGDRASRACDSCRKLKTRCYASKDKRGTCLRCETLGSSCSLASSRTVEQASRHSRHVQDESNGGFKSQDVSIERRLGRLESTLDAFISRIDSRLDTLLGDPSPRDASDTTNSPETVPSTPIQDEAPMLLIRNAAADIGIGSPDQIVTYDPPKDIISRGIIATQDVYELLCLFQIHYGRWVAFDDSLSTEQLLPHVRRSPLLLCSICLVAVRQANQQLAINLAPILFNEAKNLLLPLLLEFPQRSEFFQATLILSLWSTTIGQVPLSLDSWLLTGYALQQASANPIFMDFHQNSSYTPRSRDIYTAQFVRNHLCLAHLQYCVGTRRKSLLTQIQIDECAKVLDLDQIPQFETRMVAEVKLYWIIYTQCCASRLNLTSIRASLAAWKRDWISLFDQPRSQFLQMGHHFAILLTHCRSLQSKTTPMRSSTLTEMVHLSQSIINLAIDNTDERTSHLTDHIYHIITFSAITLCQLLQTYRGKLGGRDTEEALDALVYRLVDWLRSIGFPCHVSRVLGDVIAAYHARVTPNLYPHAHVHRRPSTRQNLTHPEDRTRHHDQMNNPIPNTNLAADSSIPAYCLSAPSASTTPLVSHNQDLPVPSFDQDFSWTACFDFDASAMEWPQYEESTDGGSGSVSVSVSEHLVIGT